MQPHRKRGIVPVPTHTPGGSETWGQTLLPRHLYVGENEILEKSCIVGGEMLEKSYSWKAKVC